MAWGTCSKITFAWIAMAYSTAWITHISRTAYTWIAVTFIAPWRIASSTANTIIAMTYWTSCCTV